MALWNDKNQGDLLEECPVCARNVSKKKKTTHVDNCCETYADFMDEIGLIKCPLYPAHILPKKYLNHHLQGNCEEVYNLLRKYFEKHELADSANKLRPECFLKDVPDEILNPNNKQLLYMLKRDLNGNDVSGNADFYPPETPPERECVETEMITFPETS